MRTTEHALCSLLLVGSLAGFSVFGAMSAAAPGGANTPGKPNPLRAMGVLLGRVSAGPLSPVGGTGRGSGQVPYPGVRLVISALDGQQIASVVTDDRGDYNIKLPTGTYRVQVASRANSPGRGAKPATVTITRGKETRLDITVDTGIREQLGISVVRIRQSSMASSRSLADYSGR